MLLGMHVDEFSGFSGDCGSFAHRSCGRDARAPWEDGDDGDLNFRPGIQREMLVNPRL